jgi:hypothetical protein
MTRAYASPITLPKGRLVVATKLPRVRNRIAVMGSELVCRIIVQKAMNVATTPRMNVPIRIHAMGREHVFPIINRMVPPAPEACVIKDSALEGEQEAPGERRAREAREPRPDKAAREQAL